MLTRDIKPVGSAHPLSAGSVNPRQPVLHYRKVVVLTREKIPTGSVSPRETGSVNPRRSMTW